MFYWEICRPCMRCSSDESISVQTFTRRHNDDRTDQQIPICLFAAVKTCYYWHILNLAHTYLPFVKDILRVPLFLFLSFPVPTFYIHLLWPRLKKKINFIMATCCRSRDTKIHSASDLINLSGGASGQEWRCDRSDHVLNLSRRSSDTTPTFGRVAGIPRRIGRGILHGRTRSARQYPCDRVCARACGRVWSRVCTWIAWFSYVFDGRHRYRYLYRALRRPTRVQLGQLATIHSALRSRELVWVMINRALCTWYHARVCLCLNTHKFARARVRA